LVNTEADFYQRVSIEEISKTATTLFNKNNCSTLYYLAKQNARA
jgi:hypothetical protein